MKKKYTKPAVVFESYELSANIAAGCEVMTNTATQNQCAYSIPGVPHAMFVEGVQNCVSKPEGGVFNGICYHIPIETNNLFNS